VTHVSDKWNKQNRSSQMADVIKTNLGVYSKTPNQTHVGTVGLIPQNFFFSILKTVLLSSLKYVIFQNKIGFLKMT